MKVRMAIGIVLLTAAAGPKIRAAEIHGRGEGRGDAYALVVGDNWRTACSVAAIEELRTRFQGDYLWLRRHGRSYLVRDRARLAEAQTLLEGDPTGKALEAERRKVARRSRELDFEQERVEKASDALRDAERRDEESERRLGELETKQRAMESEIRALEEKEEDLDRRSDALERAAEGKLWALVERWIADGAARPLPAN